MQPLRTFAFTTGAGMLGLASAALLAAAPAAAQDETLPELPQLPPVGAAPVGQAPMSRAEVETLPAEYRALPATSETTTTTVGADGVETITRTRRITATGPAPATQSVETTYGYPPLAYAPAPVVFDRAGWLAECRRRTEDLSRKERAALIGGLIGAIGGGIIGNAVSDGNSLGATLLGAGVGGVAGAAAGSAIAGDSDEYDCEDVLERYLAQPAIVQTGSARVASRVIPAPGYGYQSYGYQGYGYQPYGYSYSYAPAYPAYEYGYIQQQTVLVPVQTMQQQRVVVRETVRDELVPAARTIPRPVVEPIPVKGGSTQPRMIKN